MAMLGQVGCPPRQGTCHPAQASGCVHTHHQPKLLRRFALIHVLLLGKRNLRGQHQQAVTHVARVPLHLHCMPRHLGTIALYVIGFLLLLADESSGHAKQLSPVDTRALSWMAFGRCCLDAELHVESRPLSWDAAAFAAVATALARQPPRVTALDGLHVQVPVSQVTSPARQTS